MSRLMITAATAALLSASSAFAVIAPFTETFDSNASGWLNGASAAPTYNATGGIGDSGYISYKSTFTSGSTSVMGAPPLQILFRGNDAANASGDAFVGNWHASNVGYLTVSVRHDYTASPVTLYARLAASTPPGAAASLTADNAFLIPANTWTTLTIPVVAGSYPFSSFGSGTFTSVFAAIQNVQLGLYVPANTTFTDLTFDLDNVSIAVPEPTTAVMVLPALALLARRRA